MIKRQAPRYPSFLSGLHLAALLLLLLSACAPLQKKTPATSTLTPLSWPAHRATMQALDSWQLQGKLAYRDDQNSGSAWFDWGQHSDRFTIYLSGPFGIGTVQISGNSQAITLSQPGKTDIRAHSSHALTQRLFGWPLPVEQMRSWVKGIPANSSSHVIKTFNAKGLLHTLREEDWEISFTRYHESPYGPLPSKIKGHSDKLSFTLLLKDWDFADNTSNILDSAANRKATPQTILVGK